MHTSCIETSNEVIIYETSEYANFQMLVSGIQAKNNFCCGENVLILSFVSEKRLFWAPKTLLSVLV